MKCSHCGYEDASAFTFCPQCGSAVPQPQPAPAASVAERMTQVLKDNLFLVICILISCGSGLSLLNGDLPVLNILATIFLWLLYSQSRKGTVNEQQLRNLSGTVYAAYVINYVAYSIVAVCGIVVAFLLSAVTALPGVLDELLWEIESAAGISSDAISMILAASAVWIGVLLLVIAAGAIVLNYFSLGSIHKFVQSLYKSVEADQVQFVKRRAAQIWLLVMGILSGLSALASMDNFLTFLSEGSTATALIISSIYVKKYFPE